jgi:hypothetical protein
MASPTCTPRTRIRTPMTSRARCADPALTASKHMCANMQARTPCCCVHAGVGSWACCTWRFYATLLLCPRRCGFLGMLHMEVFMQRLDNEHGIPVVTTTPTVSSSLLIKWFLGICCTWRCSCNAWTTSTASLS